MKHITSLVLVLALAATASAVPWYTAYVNDFSTLDGVSVRCGEYPTACCENLRLEDGGAVADVITIGYAIMDIDMDPNNGINIDPPIDFTYGEFDITLEWYSEWYIPEEWVGFWLRVYSRAPDPNDPNEWVFSGGQLYFFEVMQAETGPNWQTFTRAVDDWDETNWGGPFDPTQVYKFRVDSVVWSPDFLPYSFGIDHFEFTAPHCPTDLDGDDDVDLADLALLLSNYGCAPIPPTPYYSTNGFEAYNLGDLPGQDGWEDDTTNPEYGVVQVVNDPTGSGMGKVITLDPPGTTEGTWLGAARPVDPPPSERYVVIEWDQYRTGLGDNFWYADTVAFDGWWAMQWDQNHQASSYIYDFGVALTAGQWEHVTYIIDTVGGTATVDVDGERYTGPTFMPDTVINGIVFEMEPTVHEGEDGPMYIDNVVIGQTPNAFGCTREDGDYDGDGDVDLSDLATLLADYGCSPP